MKEIRRLVFQLILSLVALFVLYLLIVFVPVVRTQGSLRSLEATAPPDIRPSAQSAAIARAPQSFQYLVSFTDSGFEPSKLTITKGQTVRFTNNSGTARQLAGESDIFAATSTIAPADFREITFNQSGTFQYSDTVSGKTGVINVK